MRVCVCVCVCFLFLLPGGRQLCCITSSSVSLMQERLSLRVLSLFLLGAYKLLRNHSHVSAALVVCKYEGRRPSCDVCTENKRRGGRETLFLQMPRVAAGRLCTVAT